MFNKILIRFSSIEVNVNVTNCKDILLNEYILYIIITYQVSASIFAANSKEQAVEPENNKLLRCRECHVTVHASCYGITILPTDIRNWACDRCKAGRNDVVRIERNLFSLFPLSL